MTEVKHFAITLFLCAVLSGCATIFNGKMQDVPLNMPEGTEIFDLDSAKNINLIHKDSSTFIRLRRDRDYLMRFTYKTEEMRITMPRSFDAQWLLPDYFCLIAPIIVDLSTGDWHSFDGVTLHFQSDSLNDNPETAACEFFNVKKSGIFALLSICDVFPSSIFFFFPNGFALGAGYEISPKFNCMFSFEQFGPDLVMPDNSEYFDLLTNFTSYQAEFHYKFLGDVYAAGGGGVSHFWVDSLNYHSHDSFHKEVMVSGFTKDLASAFVGLGYSIKSFYCEIRHTLGLSEIIFPNDERGKYETTGVRVGFVLRY